MPKRRCDYQIGDSVKVLPIPDVNPKFYGGIGIISEVRRNVDGAVILLGVIVAGIDSLVTPACVAASC